MGVFVGTRVFVVDFICVVLGGVLAKTVMVRFVFEVVYVGGWVKGGLERVGGEVGKRKRR